MPLHPSNGLVLRSFWPDVLEKILHSMLISRQPVGSLSIGCLMCLCGNIFDILEALAKMLEGV